jgi:hypothetical protein
MLFLTRCVSIVLLGPRCIVHVPPSGRLDKPLPARQLFIRGVSPRFIGSHRTLQTSHVIRYIGAGLGVAGFQDVLLDRNSLGGR